MKFLKGVFGFIILLLLVVIVWKYSVEFKTFLEAPMLKNKSSRVFAQLTQEEENIIIHKGTEKPFSGKYDAFTLSGVYACKRCGAALYRSEDKFDAGCGWPAFDKEINGAIIRLPDPDGRRVEIQCAHCGGHLGHVFTGESLTPSNVRHCVNSISMEFIPADALNDKYERAIFAGGCFWGVEYYLQQADGVIYARSGYTGGNVENPTYEQVCKGNTGHVEAVEVLFDPSQTNYEKMSRLFFEIHDPTQANGQGPDIGNQYLSVIFYKNESQKKTIQKLIKILTEKGYGVVTKLEPLKHFYPAESYHQDYYFNKGKLPYCHMPIKRFK